MSETLAADDELIKDKKRFLKRYLKSKKRIERLENKLAEIDERLYTISGKIITDMPSGGTPLTLDDLLIQKEETAERINRFVLESRTIRCEICDELDTLDDSKHAEILELFFITGESFQGIAEQTNYTERHVIRLYSDAIRLLALS